jgi:hypothetical protein
MRGSPNRRFDGRWLSPAVPTVANVAIGVLWGFSAFGGWGRTAFCEVNGSVQAGCSEDFDLVIAVSSVPAVLALALAALSWGLPGVRKDAALMDLLLSVAAMAWAFAEIILSFGGYLIQP